MTYRELLDYCKSRPGCLSSKEQKEADAIAKYRLWAAQSKKNVDK